MPARHDRARLVLFAISTLVFSDAAWAPVLPIPPTNPDPIPVPLGFRENEFGPDGSKCPGACGAGCPDSCDHEEFAQCHRDNPNLIVKGDRYTCGTHTLCTELEGCLDVCRSGIPTGPDVLGLLFGIEPAWAPVIPIPCGPEAESDCGFEPASCQSACRSEAAASAGALLGSTEAGQSAVAGWSQGHGPYDDAGVWEYTVEEQGSPERTESCNACEVCQDGRCVRDPDACPEPEPGEPGEEPPPPVISGGDVHVTSLDRLRFDLQLVGDH